MKNILYSFGCLIAVLALIPDTVAAQSFLPCDGSAANPCNSCHIVLVANTLISWLIGVIMVLFGVLAVWAGFGLVTSGGNPSALSDAKSRFTNAFIGLLIVLSAFLIVDTLMKTLIGNNGEIEGYGPWSEVKCTTQTVTSVEPENLNFMALESVPLDAVPDVQNQVYQGGIPDTPPGDLSFQGGVTYPTYSLQQVQAASGDYGYRGRAPREFLSVAEVGNSAPIGANYTLGELNVSGTCGSGGPYVYIDPRAINGLDQVVANLGAKPGINSGFRSPGCNARVGGKAGSYHRLGLAFDMRPPSGTDRCDVVQACRAAGAGFIMTYTSTSHVHCDWGPSRGESLTISC